MVDNVLQEGQEKGFSSDEAGDLSGDEVKTPIFVIQSSNEEERKDEGMEGDQAEESEDDDVAGFFVQDEYNLANSLDQMITRID